MNDNTSKKSCQERKAILATEILKLSKEYLSGDVVRDLDMEVSWEYIDSAIDVILELCKLYKEKNYTEHQRPQHLILCDRIDNSNYEIVATGMRNTCHEERNELFKILLSGENVYEKLDKLYEEYSEFE